MNARPDPLPASTDRTRAEPDELRALLADVVGDPARVAALGPRDGLFDHLPELDSIGCVNLMLAIESRYGFEVDDEDIEESLFDSLESLCGYVDARLAEARR